MKAIIIGAGRGRRLMPLTADVPKCFAEIGGKRLIDWGLTAFREAGIEEVVFIGGYQIDRVRADYPQLTYHHNAGWEGNNILLSLMHAEPDMADGFVCAYADILYRPGIVRSLLDGPGDVSLAIDTAWRERYADRTEHPEDDGEKVLARGDRVIRVSRTIPPDEAHGEYIGVARFTPAGAALFREEFQRAREQYAGQPFQAARVFEKAYLIDLFQEMLDRGHALHKVDTHGGYMEVDTTQDYFLAQRDWRG
jgi:L-glutamine-phosphate cytidylyltransferase